MVEIGRICIKRRGREAGKKCVIVDEIDENFVLIDAPDVRRRPCNLRHLEPTDLRVEIPKGAQTEEVTKALQKAEDL
jgi:large subunit ribosomal protein L14e